MTGKWWKGILFSICSLNGTEIKQDDTPDSRLASCYLCWGQTVWVYFFNNWTRFFPQLIWQRTAVTWSLVYGCSKRKCPPEQKLVIFNLLAAWDTHHCSIEMSAARPSLDSPCSLAQNPVGNLWVKTQAANCMWGTWVSDCRAHSLCLNSTSHSQGVWCTATASHRDTSSFLGV